MRRGGAAATAVFVVGVTALGVAAWATQLVDPFGPGPADTATTDEAARDAAPTDHDDTDVADEALTADQADAAQTATSRGTFYVWGRGAVDTELAAAVAPLSHVDAVTLVTSATVGLTGSRDADGDPVDEIPAGFRIPVALTAIDPASFIATLSAATAQSDRDAVAALQPGEVVLSESAAGLRGVGPGGEIDLVGAEALAVTAVVADGVGRGELLVHHDERGRLGLDETGALIVRHDAAPGTDTDALADRIAALAGDSAAVRVFDAGGHGGQADAPLILSLPEVKRRFGEFAYRPRPRVREVDLDPAWVDANIVDAEVAVLGTVRCHRRIVDDLRAALDEAVAAGFGEWIDPDAYGGCFYPRRIDAGRDDLSPHAWGIAIDINVDLSHDDLGPLPPDAVISIFGRHGFRWGGDFMQPDNHHWEWIGHRANSRPQR